MAEEIEVIAKDMEAIQDAGPVPIGRSTNPSFNVLTYSMLAINGYGCWCYFEAENMYKGKGEPIDPIDQYCRYLIEGYACAHWDAQNEEDYECIPWEEDYNAGVSLGGFYSNSDPVELLVSACNNNNPGDNCKIRACIIEGFMIINIVDAFFQNIQVVEDHRHINGFDVNAECKVKKFPSTTDTPTTTEPPRNGNPGPPTTTTVAPTTPTPKNLMSDDEECCGTYPIRHPYHPNNGLRGCCGNSSYDRMMMQCCNDYGIPEVKAVCAA